MPIADQSPPATGEGSQREDLRLISRAASHDDEVAFGEFVDRHRSRASATAARIGVDVEEAIQEGNLASWRARRSFDASRGRPASWYLTIIRNRAIDLHRKNRGRRANVAGLASLEHYADDAPSPEEAALKRDGQSQLRSAIAELPERQREVIALGFYRGLSHSEMASRIGVPVGTVKSRSRLAIGKLRASAASLQLDRNSAEPLPTTS